MKKFFVLFCVSVLAALTVKAEFTVGDLKYMDEGYNTVRCIGFANENSTT